MITRAELKAQAKAQLKGNLLTLVLCTLIMYGISFVASLHPILSIITSLTVVPALTLGLYLVYLDVANDKKAEIGVLFSCFPHMLKALCLLLLTVFFTFAWSLLFLIPGIIKGISYSMAFYILAEHPEMTAREALNESKRIMHGHKAEYFILSLSFILWDLLAIFTFGIAAIYVIPYEQLTMIKFYQNIKDPVA